MLKKKKTFDLDTDIDALNNRLINTSDTIMKKFDSSSNSKKVEKSQRKLDKTISKILKK